MIGFYNYTVWLTYLSLVSSVVGIGLAREGKLTAAVFCLLFSGFCDLFDGKVARTKKDRTAEEKRAGVAHKYPCRIEVVYKEARTAADDHCRDERRGKHLRRERRNCEERADRYRYA